MSTDPGPIRIMLVDDHAVLRSGLRLLLEREEGLEPVGEAATAEDAIRALPRLQPDVVVLDIEMPGMGGLEGATKIRERAPDARILFLSMHDQARDVRQAFDAGADGYLLKSATTMTPRSGSCPPSMSRVPPSPRAGPCSRAIAGPSAPRPAGRRRGRPAPVPRGW